MAEDAARDGGGADLGKEEGMKIKERKEKEKENEEEERKKNKGGKEERVGCRVQIRKRRVECPLRFFVFNG